MKNASGGVAPALQPALSRDDRHAVAPPFYAPYNGRNSLTPEAEFATTVTSTLYGGLRTWKGAEVFLNPELSGGQGIGSTLGVAGFPNGEAFRVNDPVPAIYWRDSSCGRRSIWVVPSSR